MEQLNTTTLYLVFTAFMGAMAKVIKEKLNKPSDFLFSFGASITFSYLAYLLGTAMGLKLVYLHILLWLGAYMGREFGEMVVTAFKTVAQDYIKKL